MSLSTNQPYAVQLGQAIGNMIGKKGAVCIPAQVKLTLTARISDAFDVFPTHSERPGPISTLATVHPVGLFRADDGARQRKKKEKMVCCRLARKLPSVCLLATIRSEGG